MIPPEWEGIGTFSNASRVFPGSRLQWRCDNHTHNNQEKLRTSYNLLILTTNKL